ncbi:MAG TPA: CPBP family intramembrane glutamic endopeptidase [Phycisphaerales bacterium]|nr:CPBP family intramembrane glutamic endopeptidase [Phycisphaerales bacterium]
MLCDKVRILGKPGLFGAASGAAVFAGIALLLAASPVLAQAAGTAGGEGAVENVREALQDAGAATKNAGQSFWDLLKSDPWKYGHLVVAGLVVVILLFADVIRPGSLERAGKRSVEPHNCMLWFACAMITYCAMLLGAGLMQFIPADYRAGDDALKMQALQSGLTYLSAIITGLVLCSLVNAGSKGAGLTFTARSLAWGAAGIICAWPVVQAAGVGFVALHEYREGAATVQSVGHPTLKLLLDNQNSPWAWSIAALAIIGAPVVEEIIYRGFLQSAILKLTGKPWTSILITSGLFMGVHMLPGNNIPWYSAATVGVLGLCMGIAFERTKEIGVPITMHVLFNLTNVILAVMFAK